MTEKERHEFDRRGEKLAYLKKCIEAKNEEIESLKKEIRRIKGEPEERENFIRVIK